MKVTTSQKRFLIIWTLFHFIALLTNLIPIRGEYKVQSASCDVCHKNMYIFAAKEYDDSENGFWPFTKIYEEDGYGYGNPYFRGIFFSYGFGEFIFYILVGFGVIFLPILWKSK